MAIPFSDTSDISDSSQLNDSASELQKPLQKTQAVAVELLAASDHAMLIGTVLAQELPTQVQVGEVAQAIEQTEELKEKLAESAETLTEVSAELEQEIAKRRAVAEQLKATRAQVELLQTEASESQKSAP